MTVVREKVYMRAPAVVTHESKPPLNDSVTATVRGSCRGVRHSTVVSSIVAHGTVMWPKCTRADDEPPRT